MIRSFFKPFTALILFIVILTFVQVIADLSLPNYMAYIVNEGIAKHNIPFILRMGGIMLIIALGGIICAISAGFLASRTALSIGKNIRNALFARTIYFSHAEFDSIGTSSLITRTTNDVMQIQNATFMMLRMLLRSPLMCIGAVFMAVQKDKGLSIILLSILPIVIVFILLVSRKAMPLFRSIQTKIDKINLILRENLVGIRIVRAFSRVGYEKRRFSEANSDLAMTATRVGRLMALLDPIMIIAMNGLSIVIIWFASFRIDAGKLEIGDMLAFIQYATQILMSLTMMTMMFIMLPRAFVSIERINQVLLMKPKIIDPEKPAHISGKKTQLTFRQVTFRFDRAENPAVNQASFSVQSGETIAIVGGTGSGKSALVNLILRSYDVESGEILFNGIDIRFLTQEDLRSRIGYVPQSTILFSGTIESNIRMGKPDATEEEIRNACRIAQASSFIEQMPEGYQSPVSQGGTNLSGGQKQRLSIARALVGKKDIYIFDDSFSALDFKTDSQLRVALKSETKNAVVIIVAQRVSSILNVDRILVMDNGRIVAIGTHTELLKSSSLYREIVFSQLSEAEIS
ncbi:MAG: ABC transporter ATP-binding protein/permease [Candidatus Azobacteroides sp.]|nr:ABC transporter ATP-binding protein/permease [Candidatus Azobacteroides sp.]